jgi:hypothetical protein
MSALNVFLTDSAVHVLTDTARYNGLTGEITGAGQKIEMNACMPAVFAVRGSLAFAPALASWCNAKFVTFDETINNLVDVAQACAETLKDIIAACGSTSLEVVVAGWSAGRERPEAYALNNHGPTPWTLTPLEVGSISPCDEEFKARLGELGIDPLNPIFDPDRDGAKILREQHLRKWFVADGVIAAIGGTAQVTRVTKDGISSRMVAL